MKTHRYPRALWGFLAGMTSFTAAQHAAAAPPPSPKTARSQTTEIAKPVDPLAMRLAEADAAFAQQDFARAHELYRQVDAITPTVATKQGIGGSLRGLGRLVEAYEVFEQLMREQGATLARADHERLEQTLATLRTATATIELTLAESGAEVTVDGTLVGASPLGRALRHMPGQVNISVNKPGFEPFAQSVELRPGEERRLLVTLAPARNNAWLSVRSSGQEPATLLIDGRDAGPLPFTGEVAVGEHRLVAKSAHGQSKEFVISAAAKGRYEAMLVLELAPARIHVSAVDPEARILIDAAAVASGRYDGELPAGSHVVTVEKTGFEPQVIKLALEPGERSNLDNIGLVPLNQRGAGAQAPDYSGLYGRLVLDGLIGRPTHSIYEDCPATSSGGSCKSWPVGGAEIDTRIGYSFGVIGVEGFALLGTTATQANMTFPADLSERESVWYGVARTERLILVNLGIAGGIAGRISSKSQHLRLSSGWGIGIAWHKPQIGRTLEALPSTTRDLTVRQDANSNWTSGQSRLQPLLIWDADIELGDTPGLRFLLGLMCQLEFGAAAPSSVGTSALGYTAPGGVHLAAGGGEVRAWGSPAYYFGPRIGLAMGH